MWATDDEYVALAVTWMFYQDMSQAYGHPKKSEGKKLMERIINTLRKGVPKGLQELAQLGWTWWRRREDVLAYFDIGASNGPTHGHRWPTRCCVPVGCERCLPGQHHSRR